MSSQVFRYALCPVTTLITSNTETFLGHPGMTLICCPSSSALWKFLKSSMSYRVLGLDLQSATNAPPDGGAGALPEAM